MQPKEGTLEPVYGISQAESRRIQILKIWLTILVLLWHADRTEVRFLGGDTLLMVPIWLEGAKFVLSRVIARCSVPGFFFLAAVLLYRKPFRWGDNMKKKVRSLVVPYLIINTFWVLFYFIGQSIPQTRQYFANQNKLVASWGIQEYLNAYLGLIPNSEGTAYNPMVAPLWFVRDLFVLNLLAPMLKKIIDRFPKVIFVLLVAMVVLDVNTHIFCLSTTALAYFCFGYYLVRSGKHLTDADHIPAVPLLLVYVLSGVLIGVAVYLQMAPMEPVVRFINVVSGFLVFFRFGTRFPSRVEKKVLWVAQYSFPIYIFHEPALGMLQKLSVKFLDTGAAAQAVTYFAAPVVIFVCTLAFSAILQRFLPRLYALVTGGRRRQG